MKRLPASGTHRGWVSGRGADHPPYGGLLQPVDGAGRPARMRDASLGGAAAHGDLPAPETNHWSERQIWPDCVD